MSSFQKGVGTQVKLSTAFHCQADGQLEHTIQKPKVVLRASASDFKGNWDYHLPLLEISYNNRYNSSIYMTPFEALYRRRCRSLFRWFEADKSSFLCPECDIWEYPLDVIGIVAPFED